MPAVQNERSFGLPQALQQQERLRVDSTGSDQPVLALPCRENPRKARRIDAAANPDLVAYQGCVDRPARFLSPKRRNRQGMQRGLIAGPDVARTPERPRFSPPCPAGPP